MHRVWRAAVQGLRCLKHLVKARERQRQKRGLKRRYYGTLSYKLAGGFLVLNPHRFDRVFALGLCGRGCRAAFRRGDLCP